MASGGQGDGFSALGFGLRGLSLRDGVKGLEFGV